MAVPSSIVQPLNGCSVLVLGLGDSGLAMAQWCARQGARVRVWDSRAQPPQADALAATVPQAERLGGSLNAEALAGIRRVLKSPGLAPNDERIEAVLAAADAAGVPVHGELDLFAEALAELRRDADYRPRLIAVTGTNGKTTTTAMTALLVERAGRRVVAAGNIGPSLLAALSAALDAQAADATPLPEVWVLELSSFQLHGVRGFEPDAAAILNVTQDHLDWHGTMAAYAEAKGRIAGERAVIVANRDDQIVEALIAQITAPKAAVRGSAKSRSAAAGTRSAPREVIRFGLGLPRRPGDFGIVDDHGMAWLVRAHPLETMPSGRRASPVAELADDVPLQRLMPADALRVRGRHNAANALAALALATAIGNPLSASLYGLREYSGEPHRVAFVATIDGVEAYDDSKGTNVGATVAAINGLGADRAPARLVLLLGGDGKGQDFTPLATPVRRHARAVATIGRDAALIESALDLSACRDAGISVERHASLEAATAWAFAQAKPGDAVLLSPACASLDMFRNYVHRAEVFALAVQAVAADRGVIAE